MRWLLLKDLQILRRSPLLVGAARRLPDRDRAADRLRALARPGQAAGRVPQRDRRREPEHVQPRRRDGRRPQVRRQALQVDRRRSRVHSRAPRRSRKVRVGRGARARCHPAPTSRRSCSDRRARAADDRGHLQRRQPAQAAASSQSARSSRARRRQPGALREVRRGRRALPRPAARRAALLRCSGTTSTSSGCSSAQTILARRAPRLPRGAPERAALDQVARFATLAIDNLDLSNDVLGVDRPADARQARRSSAASARRWTPSRWRSR